MKFPFQFLSRIARLQRIWRWAVLAGCGGLLFPALSHAQTWVRDSISKPDILTGSSGTRANAGSSSGGTSGISGTIRVEAGLEYTDNLRLERAGTSAMALVLGVGGGVRMPLTVNNELYLEVSARRHIYLDGASNITGFQSISPGTNLGLDVFISRLKLRGFVSASLQEDPVASVVVNQTERFGRLNIDAGIQGDWDMNRVVLQGIGSVGRQIHTYGDGSLDAWRQAFALRPFFPTGPASGVGLSAALSEIDYDRQIQNDVATSSFGAFGVKTIGRNKRVVAELGWQDSNYEDVGSINDPDDFSGFYGSVSFDHQLRRAVRYSAYLRRELQDGIGTNFYRITSVMLTPQLALWQETHLDLSLSHEWIDESGPLGESATRLAATVMLQRALSSKLSGSLQWRFYDKQSDDLVRSYERNQVTLMFEYSP